MTVPLLYHLEKLQALERMRTDDRFAASREAVAISLAANKEALALALAAKEGSTSSTHWGIDKLIGVIALLVSLAAIFWKSIK